MKPGVTELLIVLLVVIVIFGPTQIPKLAKMLGKSVKSLRAGMADDEDEPKKDKEDSAEK